MLLWLPVPDQYLGALLGLIYRLRYSVLLLPAVAIFGVFMLTTVAAKERLLILAGCHNDLAVALLVYFRKRIRREGFLPALGALTVPAAGLVLFIIARVSDRYEWALLPLCLLGMQLPLLAREYHPMVLETLEHEFIEPQRQEVMRYIRQNYDGKRILIDMGKQAPLVYDLGLNVKEFVLQRRGRNTLE